MFKIIAALLILVSPAFANETNKPQKDIIVTIKTNQEVYRIGDIFAIYGQVENVSDKTFYYEASMQFSGFLPEVILTDLKGDYQTAFLGLPSQGRGVFPSPAVLVGPKSKYPFSILGKVVKGKVILSSDKEGKHPVEGNGLSIQFMREPSYFLESAGSFYVKVQCGLGSEIKDGPFDEKYVKKQGFESNEIKVAVLDEQNSSIDVNKELTLALDAGAYENGYDIITSAFYEESSSFNKGRNKDTPEYKTDYTKLVDKYLGMSDQYTKRVELILMGKDNVRLYRVLAEEFMKMPSIIFTLRNIDSALWEQKITEFQKKNMEKQRLLMQPEFFKQAASSNK